MKSFSQIKRCTWQNTYGTKEQKEKLLNKYMCQVFSKDGEYIKVLIGDTYKEVVDLQQKELEGNE